MRENYTLTRLYIDDNLYADARLELSKDHIHYLLNVLRLEAGGSLRVFNGRDGEWRADIVDLSKRNGALSLQERLRPPKSAPDIWLCFAPLRRHRTNFILEKATELGVSVLQPILTGRTQFGKLKLEKLSAQIIEAAEQTERLCLPDLHAPIPLNDVLSGWDATRTLIMADEAGNCPPALKVLQDIKGPSALLIGPEGGFTSDERDQLRSHLAVKPVSLGPRILRADTAALSLLTLWQATQGDWD